MLCTNRNDTLTTVSRLQNSSYRHRQKTT